MKNNWKDHLGNNIPHYICGVMHNLFPHRYDMKSTVLQSILLAITQSCSLLILAGGFVLASHIYTSDSSKPYHANLSQLFRYLVFF